MPSQSFPNQTVLLTVTLQGHWLAIGASGQFLLPSLRGRHNVEQRFLPLNEILSNQRFDVGPAEPHPVDEQTHRRMLNAQFFYLWAGEIYVECQHDDDFTTNPTRVEWSGAVRVATGEDLGRYFLSPSRNADTGPIGMMPGGLLE